MDLARLEEHLSNWVQYMRQPSHKLGYPAKSLCIASGGSACADAFEYMCDDMDTDNAITLDAMIDSLPPSQSCAIHHKWLHAVYRMRDIEAAYLDALDNLLLMADRRGLV
jgi:hypothetical protein